jgi:uncharacterized membrane protein YbaN (DUF454 family)
MHFMLIKSIKKYKRWLHQHKNYATMLYVNNMQQL